MWESQGYVRTVDHNSCKRKTNDSKTDVIKRDYRQLAIISERSKDVKKKDKISAGHRGM